MKPPYTITDKILELVVAISEKIGEINANHLYKPTTELRKKNRIKTIQSSLEIEGNTLSEEQITALLENKRIIAPAKDILEVQNAIEVYDDLKRFNVNKIKDLEFAHSILMKDLIRNAGKFRTTNVGIVKGSKVEHLAPGGTMVKGLMNDLFTYLKNDKDLILIKSCVFHYEFEFIHPFVDGNGRMGRLWQTLILMQQYPVFEFLPVESLIKENQKKYYNKLSESDKIGQSTPFIEFMLAIILESLKQLLQSQNINLSIKDRLFLFKDKIGSKKFSRKDYLENFKSISAPTASRDLKWAVGQSILMKFGEQRLTEYQFKD
ncbi:Fic family protein [Chryseobacterium sp. ERMR1:04]|uniref:Fic family protein n=1 Tax=Chryseobacterium sp. ERMR1:04 TaxID=1705393 RepID=UPI0006C89609|nr:Fic family protein [Chryseobacterium sp. ERMR1:04]KPH15157.1 cell filamentation protein Fic [Chryseobacterium sp. ERMR1:04]